MQSDDRLVTERQELLYRQVISSWIKDDGTPASVAFRPTPKDERKLSTDRQRAGAEGSYKRYETNCGHPPAGTWAIGVGAVLDAHSGLDEALQETHALTIIDDAGTEGNHADHASIAFGPAESKNQERKVHERLAKTLQNDAIERGMQYPKS